MTAAAASQPQDLAAFTNNSASIDHGVSQGRRLFVDVPHRSSACAAFRYEQSHDGVRARADAIDGMAFAVDTHADRDPALDKRVSSISCNERPTNDNLRTMTTKLLDILMNRGFDQNLPTKLVRHKDRRYDVDELRRKCHLELYQCYQAKPKFDGAKQIVSFYGLPGTQARFYGVYKILDCRPACQGRTLASSDWPQKWTKGARFFYELERDPWFEGLRDQLTIDWGNGTRAWVQNLRDKLVLEGP